MKEFLVKNKKMIGKGATVFYFVFVLLFIPMHYYYSFLIWDYEFTYIVKIINWCIIINWFDKLLPLSKIYQKVLWFIGLILFVCISVYLFFFDSIFYLLQNQDM